MAGFRVDRRKLIGAGLVSAGAVGLVGSQAFAQGTPAGTPPAPSFEAAEAGNVVFSYGPEDVFEYQVEGPLDGPRVMPFPGPGIGLGAGPMVAGAFRKAIVGPLSAESLAKELADAKADRDAAASKGDVSAASALLQTAEGLIGQTGPNLKSSDTSAMMKARQQAGAASGAIRAARAQLQVVAGSLPSMQAPTSGELNMAHKVVADATSAAKGGSAPAEAGALVQQAQALYKQAFDLFGAGQYDKAGQAARGATAAAMAARGLVPPKPVAPANPGAPPPPTF